MLRYALWRLLHSVPLLVGISIASFVLIHLAPGDPARIMLGPRATPTNVAQLRHELRLDRPLLTQYLDFLRGIPTFSFGRSIQFDDTVANLITPRLAPSALLILFSTLGSALIAVPLGLLSGVRANRASDQVVRAASMVTFAMPSFWLGLLLILAFSLDLHWLPTGGYGQGAGSHLRALVLPSITLALYMAPIQLRTLRSSVIETLRSDFIEAARAHGLGRGRIIVKHVLRNSALSFVTVVGANIGFLLSGTVVVETVFSLSGLGSLLVTSVNARDFPVIQALTLLFAFAVIVINLATDLSYALIDPRIRL